MKNLFPLPLFNLDGAAGGGQASGGAGGAAAGGAGAGGQAAGGGGGGSAAAGAAAAGAASPAAAKNPFTGEAVGKSDAAPAAAKGAEGGPYYPEKLPEHLRGANERETIDKIFAAYSGSREEIAKRGSAPKDVAEYKIEFGDDLKKAFGDPETNERIKLAKTIGHKHGLTKEQLAGFVTDYHAGLLEKGIEAVYDPAKEARAILGSAALGRNEAEIAQEAGKIWTDAVQWIDGMVASKTFSAAAADILKNALPTADGVALVRAIKQLTMESAINPGAGTAAGGMTKEDLAKRAASPEVDPLNPKFDPRKARQLEADYRAFYGAGGG